MSDRDTDRSPKGRNGEAGSTRSARAGAGTASPNPQPVSEADLDALVERLRAKTVQLLESRHATAAYAIQDALFAITSLRNQLTASEARERELREALRDLSEAARNACEAHRHPPLTEALYEADGLTNTENHHG